MVEQAQHRPYTRALPDARQRGLMVEQLDTARTTRLDVAYDRSTPGSLRRGSSLPAASKASAAPKRAATARCGARRGTGREGRSSLPAKTSAWQPVVRALASRRQALGAAGLGENAATRGADGHNSGRPLTLGLVRQRAGRAARASPTERQRRSHRRAIGACPLAGQRGRKRTRTRDLQRSSSCLRGRGHPWRGKPPGQRRAATTHPLGKEDERGALARQNDDTAAALARLAAGVRSTASETDSTRASRRQEQPDLRYAGARTSDRSRNGKGASTAT